MASVGILTFHNTANYGAALQAYALQTAIRGLGCDAEVIDYASEFRRAIYSPHRRAWNQIRRGRNFVGTVVGAPVAYARLRRFNSFYRTHMRVGKVKFRSPTALSAAPPTYDFYVVGSDQVWSYRNNGRDFNYMLSFVREPRRTVAYAPSFGVSELPEDLVGDYSRTIARIHALSVRERDGAELVRRLTGRTAQVVADPVFLLEPAQWSAIEDGAATPTGPYILRYTSNPRYWQDFLRITNYPIGRQKIVHIGTDVRPRDMLDRRVSIAVDVGPQQFVHLVRNASLVVTSSFHGTALAIITRRPFIACLSGDKGRDSRITNLLESVGLMNRILGPELRATDVAAEIPYEDVARRVDDMVGASLRFLKGALTRRVD